MPQVKTGFEFEIIAHSMQLCASVPVSFLKKLEISVDIIN